MHISFFPSLGSRSSVPISATESFNAEPVRAAFTARLSAADYDEAFHLGARIEVWTNVPGNGRRSGEWGAIAFEEVHSAMESQPDEGMGAGTSAVLRLSADNGSVDEGLLSPAVPDYTCEHVFRAVFTLPRTLGRTCAFTYRLVYPSGICWLGSDRNNGLLEFGAGNGFFEESGDWERHKEENIFLHDQERSVEEDINVGWLNTQSWRWSGWALDESSVWSIADILHDADRKASLIYLIPSAIEDAILLPQPHLIRATSWLSPISISSQGKVTLHSSGQGTVEHRAHSLKSENDQRLLRSEIISSCPAPEIIKLKDNFYTILFSPNNVSDVSSTIYVQPLSIPAARDIHVPMHYLDVFAKNSPVVSLYNHGTHSALFIDRAHPPEDNLLRLGVAGGYFVISTVHELGVSKDPFSELQVSLLSHAVHPKRFFSEKVENPLPTPPSSPAHRPRHTVSFALPPEGDSELDFGLRRRRPAQEHSDFASEGREVMPRTEIQTSMLQRVRGDASAGQVRTFVLNVLEMLGRLLGIAILHVFTLAFRFLAAARRDGPLWEDETSTDGVESPIHQIEHSNTGTRDALGAVRDSDSIPSIDYGDSGSIIKSESGAAPSDPPSDPHQMSTYSEPPALWDVLKWVIPASSAPILLGVRYSSSVNLRAAKVDIEVDGVAVDSGSSTIVHDVGGNTVVYEIARAHGASSVLLVRPRT
ncbi:hypothetical protein EW145_g1706 [Phellinidium pouzarii]|uniref:Uncharacterized protein n=1 Tax=Phellinidium pouzarii TaxID=167371 RepID=A0A4S4LDG3_9AGAM|nr:hypothetical protein EW145_g1706 [Phellinidium pouzarii]